MAAAGGGVKSVAGEDLAVPFDPEGSRGPDIELGHGRPMTRSQRGVSQTPKGRKGGQGGQGGKGNKGHSGPPPETQSSSKGKQPSQNLRAEHAGGPPLPGAQAAPTRSQPQPSSSGSSGLSSSRHFERPVGNLEAPESTLSSATTTAASTSLGFVAFHQALCTGTGPRSHVPVSSRAGRDPSTPAGRGGPQARAHDEEDYSDGDDSEDPRGSSSTEGLVLRSRIVPHPSSAAEVVFLEACPETQRASWNLHPRPTARVPVAHSGSTRSSSQRGSSHATPSRGRSTRSSSQRGSSHATPSRGRSTRSSSQRGSSHATPSRGRSTSSSSQRGSSRITPSRGRSTRSSSQRGSSSATPSRGRGRGRSTRSSFQIRSSLIRVSQSSCNRPAVPRRAS
uniref:Predicted gene 6470 n=1 Tax=Mus musculus TaxID=10090 RepID=A0ABA7IXE7_MOUSE